MCIYIGPKTILSNILAFEDNRRVTYAQAIEYTHRLKNMLKRKKIYPYFIFNTDEIKEVLARTNIMREFNETVFVLDKNGIKLMADEMNEDYDETVREAICSCVKATN